MDNPVIIIIGLVVIAVVVFLVLRSRKPSGADLEAGGASKAIDKPAAKVDTRPKPAPADRHPEPVAPAERPAPKTDERAAPVATTPREAPVATPAVEPSTVAASDDVEIPVDVPVETATPADVVRPATGEGARGRSVRPPRDNTALRKGLTQARTGWVQKLAGIFGGKKEIDPELLEQIQETLLTSDVGPRTTERLTEVLKDRLGSKDLSNQDAVWTTLQDVVHEVINVEGPSFGARAQGKPLVILVVGVNGVGKTTTIGKLASRYKDQGKKVYLAAADTFRAAAVAQLEAWGKRVGVPVVKGKDLTKPSAVVFDAVQTGIKEGADVVIADTAGRLHTKTPLMDELRKLRDAATKALPGAPHEILLVLDATTGQNGLIQVKEFRDALDLTGIVLTKLDGTAKGGVILSICDEFKLPVRFVGVGEKVDDLREFDAADFADALFARDSDAGAAS